MANAPGVRRLAPIWGYIMLPFFLALSIIAGLYSGDVEMSFSELIQMLKLGPWGSSEEAFKLSVIWQIRLPRIIATAASGAILAASGVAFQSVLRNPLAEPYTLGVSSGAAFGAACAIVSGVPWISGFSFLGSISALFIVWVLGERKNDPDISRIILAGVIVGSVLGAGLTLLKALAGEKVSAIIIWLMGSFSAATWWDVPPLFFALCVLLMFCASNCKEMDIMALGTNAAALGVDLSKKKLMILGGASCAVSFVVSRFGVIGFVGLVVPHLLRILFGPAHHTLLPLSLLAGGALLCLADTIAKMWNELPAGVLTVLIGGPVFCAILWNRK